MTRLDRTSIRMIGGIAFVLVFAAVLIFIYVAVRPSEADVDRAADALKAESHPAEQRDPYARPDVVRWNFVTRLPVADEVNAYRWRAQGGMACSLDGDRVRLVNFHLDTLNAEDPIELSALVAIFDKAARTLTSRADAQVVFTWGTVTSTDMRIELDTINAFFDENVVVVVTEKANVGLVPDGAEASDDDGTGANEATDADGADAADDDTTEEPKEPLKITSKHFEIDSAKDTGEFTGNVIAKDGSGTIWADKMIVEYYTTEERQADPTLSGMKRITCIGHVRIDQKTEQAVCEQAVFDIAKNIITMEKSETAQVLYRKDTGEEKYQIKADMVVIDRNPGGKTIFSGTTETIDFSSTREGFFGLVEKDEETEADDGAGPTDEQ